MEDASTPIFINSFEYFELFCEWLNAKNKKTKYRKNLILYKQTKLKLIVYLIIITKLVYYFYIQIIIMIKHIPNLFTLLNLLCGCVATVLLFENEINIYLVALIVFIGIVFDFLDGFLARKFNIQSKLGLELDSLADLITSGLVPGIIIFRLFKIPNDLTFSIISDDWFAYFAFIITISSAYRLAKFNIQENSKSYFLGLPVPANTILILSLLLILNTSNYDFVLDVITNDFLLIAVVLISSFLMNSNYKFISLKFDGYDFNKLNNFRYFIIFSSIILFFTMSYISIPLIFLIYFLTSFLAFRN